MLLVAFLVGLQILTEHIVSNHELISTEVNIEVEKEEKEHKDEYFDDSPNFSFQIKKQTNYSSYFEPGYKKPVIAVLTSPPERVSCYS